MTTGFLLAAGDEDTLIDSYRPQTDAQPATITHQDIPGRNLQNIVEPSRSGLPDPAVGGVGGSGTRNGYSVGFFGRRKRVRDFDGAMATLPPVTANPVQGLVGTQNNHAGNLYGGVRSQLANYQAGAAADAQSYVGNLGLGKAASE